MSNQEWGVGKQLGQNTRRVQVALIFTLRKAPCKRQYSNSAGKKSIARDNAPTAGANSGAAPKCEYFLSARKKVRKRAARRL